jgi:hypothetical protein
VEPQARVVDILHRQLLVRAVTRGLLKQAQLLEVTRRVRGGQPLGEALRELGAAPEAIEALADASLVGRTIGRFRIEALLGCGGMGTVYRARQQGLDREVAVKVFDVRFALHATEVERFRREAQSACKLDHPHVIQPIDFGEEGPILYLAMEYAAGGSAEARLAARGRYGEQDALDTIADIASALDYAASRGLVHRDVKPGNILYAASGAAKLGDLGLVLDTQAARLTQGDAATGTVHYMAPEQALARALDIRADVYGLGITAFELVTGVAPFDGPSAIAIVAQHMKAPLPDLRARRPEVSEGFARLLGRMCAKAAKDRPLPEELIALVESVRAGREIGVAPAHAGSAAESAGAPGTAGAGEGDGADAGEGEADALPRRARQPSRDPTAAEGVDAAGAAAVDAAAADEDAGDADPRRARLPPRRPSTPGDDAASAGAAARGRGVRLGGGLAAVVAAVAIAVGLWWSRREGAGGAASTGEPRASAAAPAVTLDPIAEARAIEELKALLLARLAPDGGFSEMAGEPTDPWVSGQALEALLLCDDPALRDRLARALARVEELALDGAATGDPPGFAGFPYLVAVDTVACTEATAAVGRAVALGFGRVDPPPERLARRLLDYLLRVQAPSGAWATIPVLGDDGAMTSATGDALAAVAALAAALGEEPRALPAVERAAGWLAGVYDRGAGRFAVNPRRSAGAARFVDGLDESMALALLDALALAARARASGRAGPAPGESSGMDAARAVLADLAARFEPSPLPHGAAAEAAMEDYRFQRLLPPRYRTSASEFAWLPGSWRLALASAFGGAGAAGGGEAGPDVAASFPERERWAAEAARLRAQVPLLPELYRDVPQTWKLAEVLIGPATVRAGEAAEVRPGLMPLVRRPTPR